MSEIENNDDVKQPEKSGRVLYSLPEKMSIVQLAHCFKMDRRTISDRLSEAQLPYKPGAKGSKIYVVQDALPVMYNKGLKGNVDVDAETDKEKMLLTRLKRESAEIELQLIRRTAIPLKEVIETVKREYEFVRARIRAIPNRINRKLAVVVDPIEISDMLMEVIDDALSELKYDAEVNLATANVPEPSEISVAPGLPEDPVE